MLEGPAYLVLVRVPTHEGLTVVTDHIASAGRLDLLPVPEAAAQARQFVAGFCRDARVDEEDSATAVLLTSELVTNAILHARTASVLHVSVPPGRLRVLVQDDSPAVPVRGGPGPERVGGRGLLLVEEMAWAWGVDPSSPGKDVWFELCV
jgi:anti-sigma regulatory factor (Ser/Thr protein kinase)